ncbi:unnamed protein product [Closterium sp. NIES-54]
MSMLAIPDLDIDYTIRCSLRSSIKIAKAAASMVTCEDPKDPALDQEGVAEAPSDAPASTSIGDIQEAPVATAAPVASVPTPVAPESSASAERRFPVGGYDEDEEEDDGYFSDDSDEGIDVHAKGVLASKTRVTLTLLIPFELAKEMRAVKPSCILSWSTCGRSYRKTHWRDLRFRSSYQNSERMSD